MRFFQFTPLGSSHFADAEIRLCDCRRVHIGRLSCGIQTGCIRRLEFDDNARGGASAKP
jgi:hypothetical protein